MSTPENRGASSPNNTVSGWGLLVRLGWMLFGNAVLLMCIVSIPQARGVSFLSAADYGLWATVVVLIALRYLDITKFKGMTVTDKPATMAHWRRYVILLCVGAAVAWGAAHRIAYISR